MMIKRASRGLLLCRRHVSSRFLSSSADDGRLVTVETVANGVAKITLNDPKHLNALTVDMGDAFLDAIDSVATSVRRGEVRAAVLTGAGSAFSAGGDMQWLLQRCDASRDANMETMLDFYSRFLSIRSLPVPVVASLHGPAIGAGLGVALACDTRVAWSEAKLGVSERVRE